MPGSVHFSIDIDGDRELSRRIDGVLDRVQDLRPVWQRIVADWSATMHRKFEAEGNIEGDPKWPELSEKYAAWKANHFPGTGILIRTGAMREAATNPEVEMSETSLRMTIDSEWALYHQSSRPRTRLPRRPFASLTRKQKTRWTRFVLEQIREEAAPT